jgi:ABC-type uncharacterized transport system ATPase subunit
MFAIEMKHITKRFGSLMANDSIDFIVKTGEIHALVGENGAGKSTLMNILYGMHQPDHGDIFINGKQEIIHSPAKAISLGIGMVHQHFMLIPPLTVTENIILGDEPISKYHTIDVKQAEATIQKLSETYSLKVDAREKIETLSVGIQQRVEILKILYRKANILILDEPTPVLTPQEIEELFTTLRNLTIKGKTVILITHKLREVISISDSVTILRHGKSIVKVDTKFTNKDELALLMVGKEIEPPLQKTTKPQQEDGLIVENLSALNERRLPALRNISFSVAKGEILGIAAVEGNGQSELAEVLTGLRKPIAGKIIITGITVDPTSSKNIIGHIPEDRLKRGIVLDFTLADNLILGRQQEKSFYSNMLLSKAKISIYADRLIQQFDIRPPKKNQNVRGFSGGNQQKAVVARELSKDSPIIIASQPTRGLDIYATKFVHDSLLSERNKGKAILLVTSDLEELLELSDRIAVMYEGEIITILYSHETSERDLGQFMTGAKNKIA